MADRSDETAWAVSSGSYSYYRVHCICRTQADAEEVARKMRTCGVGTSGYPESDASVESFPVLAGDVEPVAVLAMQVQIWDDGTTSDLREEQTDEWAFDTWRQPLRPVHWRWVRAPIHHGRGGRLEVWGTDLERVRRVFSDRRAMLIAQSDLRAQVAAEMASEDAAAGEDR